MQGNLKKVVNQNSFWGGCLKRYFMLDFNEGTLNVYNTSVNLENKTYHKVSRISNVYMPMDDKDEN